MSNCPWDSSGKNTGVRCIPFSRGSSWPRDQTHVSCIVGEFFTIWTTREAPHPPRLSLNMPSRLLPQGLCTLCSIRPWAALPSYQDFGFYFLVTSLIWPQCPFVRDPFPDHPLLPPAFSILLSTFSFLHSTYHPLKFFALFLYFSLAHPPTLDLGLSLLFPTVSSGSKKVPGKQLAWLCTYVSNKVENSPRKGKLSCIFWIIFSGELTLGSEEESQDAGLSHPRSFVLRGQLVLDGLSALLQ